MRKTKYNALGGLKNMNFRGFPQFREEYRKAIDEINEKKNNERIIELAKESGESVEVVKAKLDADKDYRDEAYR